MYYRLANSLQSPRQTKELRCCFSPPTVWNARVYHGSVKLTSCLQHSLFSLSGTQLYSEVIASPAADYTAGPALARIVSSSVREVFVPLEHDMFVQGVVEM